MKLFRLSVLGISLSLLLLYIPTGSVSASSPEILGISPSYAYSDTDFNFVMKITGRGFTQGTQVNISYPIVGADAPIVKSIGFISGSELRAEIEVQYNNQEGFYDVTVTSEDGFSSITRTGGLELKEKSQTSSFYPVITNVTPPTVPTGEQRSLIITGEQFAGTNPLVRLIRTNGSEWYDIEAVRLNHTEIHATVPNDMIVDTYDVLVRGTGGYGGNQFIKSDALIVELAPEPVPELTPPSNGADAESEPEPTTPVTPSVPTSGQTASTHNASTVVPQPKSAPAYFPNPWDYDYQASFISQSGTVATGIDGILTHVASATRGSDILMWIKFKNTSSRQWWYQETLDPDDIHEIRLGLTQDATSIFAHSDWISINRLAKISQNIGPGETATLEFRLHIPENLAPGAYKLSVGLVAEWIKWMYDDVHWEIQVS